MARDSPVHVTGLSRDRPAIFTSRISAVAVACALAPFAITLSSASRRDSLFALRQFGVLGLDRAHGDQDRFHGRASRRHGLHEVGDAHRPPSIPGRTEPLR